MEIDALRLLVAVAEQGSFTRASVITGVSQPALSRNVQRLEQEFDARLFYRDGRGVKPTETGRKLLAHAEAFFESIDRLKEDSLSGKQQFRGTVVLGLPPSFGTAVSAALVRRFREEHPDANVRVIVAFSGALAEWLESGRIDVAVLYDVHRGGTLLVTPLLTEFLYLVEAADGATPLGTAKPSELGTGNYVVTGPENGLRKVVEAVARRDGCTMKIAAEVESLDATKELVEAGDLRCVLPLGAVHREVAAGRLVARRFDDTRMRALLVLATPLHRPVTRLATAILKLVEREAGRFIDRGILGGTKARELPEPSADRRARYPKGISDIRATPAKRLTAALRGT